jgi:class 3 adenylate cyclase/tRNA A-37 threonylcarbamoyl transferase component Bud32
METVATVLYARLRNVLPLCNALPPELGADFADELRAVLSGPIAKQNGVIAQQRADSVLAVFGNAPGDKPDHARRALHAAVLAVYEAAALNRRLAARLPGGGAPPLALAAGVHLGRLDVVAAAAGNSGAVRATGESVEIARVLECTAPDVGWSIVASEQARRAAGERIQSGRFGSVALPDSSFVDIAEITGLQPLKDSRNPPQTYLALQDAISLNQRHYGRPQELAGAASEAARNAAMHFSIEGYRIERKIGEGGMASIYLASAEDGGEPQVLKVMRISGSEESDNLQRFIQEFALLAQVTHRNVAQIHRQGFSSGHAYIAMEYFSRGDLRARIAQGIDGAAALSYTRQIAAALDAIHGASIVHRDLKPDNLMLRKDGSLALADFGIAKHVAMLITDTAHGEVVGTPYYLSPEQAMGEPVDHRCDLYSLGVMLYEMLTGMKPYRAASAEELLDLHVNGPVPLLRPPHERLQPLLERLMAKDRAKRYGSARELLADLARVDL